MKEPTTQVKTVNENYDEEYATVVNDPVQARESAWDWWHDVKDQPRGR